MFGFDGDYAGLKKHKKNISNNISGIAIVKAEMKRVGIFKSQFFIRSAMLKATTERPHPLIINMIIIYQLNGYGAEYVLKTNADIIHAA